MINKIFLSLIILFFIQILPIWNHQFESCCSNDKKTNNTMRHLSCPTNSSIKIRSVIFYTGNGCARSACQKRANKHYLSCNNHRTCSISIECILMDTSQCSSLTKSDNHAQYMIVDYDCILSKTDISLIDKNNKTKQDDKDKIVLFSAKVNIESPPDLYNDSAFINSENEWKDFLMKKYFHQDKPTVIQQPQRSLLTDILRTIIILIVFVFILIVLMIIGLFIYKRIRLMKKRKFYDQEKHQPFPADDAYDNLKTTTPTANESASETGTTTDV